MLIAACLGSGQCSVSPQAPSSVQDWQEVQLLAAALRYLPKVRSFIIMLPFQKQGLGSIPGYMQANMGFKTFLACLLVQLLGSKAQVQLPHKIS